MKEYQFTIILAAKPDEEQSDLLYNTIDDGIRSAIADIRGAGFDVIRVEIGPDSVLQAS